MVTTNDNRVNLEQVCSLNIEQSRLLQKSQRNSICDMGNIMIMAGYDQLAHIFKRFFLQSMNEQRIIWFSRQKEKKQFKMQNVFRGNFPHTLRWNAKEGLVFGKNILFPDNDTNNSLSISRHAR